MCLQNILRVLGNPEVLRFHIFVPRTKGRGRLFLRIKSYVILANPEVLRFHIFLPKTKGLFPYQVLCYTLNMAYKKQRVLKTSPVSYFFRKLD